MYRWLFILSAFVLLLNGCVYWLVRNPGDIESHVPFEPVKVSREKLRDHVEYLAGITPPRNYENIQSLDKAADYISAQCKSLGYTVLNQEFTDQGREYRNVHAFVGPEQAPRIVVGAHYDVCGNQMGADDNASGVAGLIELSRYLKQNEGRLKSRFELVAYALEEPPYFDEHLMGSAVHARSLLQEKADVRMMISLEMLGYFSDEKNSQTYPLPLMTLWYPTVGNYIIVVGDMSISGRKLTRQFRSGMKRGGSVPVYSINAPKMVPGVDFSDHRNYWAAGFPALMVTDTAFFRNQNYHETTDTPGTLDYERMAVVVEEIYRGLMEIQASDP